MTRVKNRFWQKVIAININNGDIIEMIVSNFGNCRRKPMPRDGQKVTNFKLWI